MPANAPRVSVLMPVRDGEAYLREALDSVLGQSFADLELLVLDDGSADGTPELLAAAAARDARMRVERRERIGLTAGLNELCDLARGEVLVRMDADDVSLPDRIERQVAFLDAHTDVALVGGAVVLVDAAGRRLGTARYPTDDARIRRALLSYNCIPHATVAMRAEAVREAGGYRLERAQDYDLWLRVAERNRLANLAEPLLFLRQHGGQVSETQVELQALTSLAVRAAARARAAGRPDPLQGAPAVDRPLVESLGVPPGAIDTALVDACLALAAAREAGGDDAGAAALRTRAAELGGARRVEVSAALRRAQLALGAGRRADALRAGAGALRHPLLAVHEVARVLRARPQGRVARS